MSIKIIYLLNEVNEMRTKKLAVFRHNKILLIFSGNSFIHKRINVINNN